MARGVRFLGHPLHPAFVHAPLGLLLSLPLWDALALWQGGSEWWTVAFWVGAAGVAASGLAVLTGLIDLLGVPPRAMLLVFAHMSVMGLAVLLAAISVAALHDHGALPGARMPRAAFATDASMAALLALGGWLGGHLVYRHRVGVHRAPPTEDG